MKSFRGASIYFKGNVGVMLISWLLYGIGSSITNPYLSIYMKMLGANSVMVGMIYSLGMLAQLMTIIPGSRLTDTIGRRRSILIGTWGVAVTTLFYVVVPNWQSLLVIYVLNSAMAFYQPALMATILDTLPPSKRASGVMIVSVLPQLPAIILPPLGGELIGRYGLLGIRLAYLVSTIVSFLVAVIRHRSLAETLSEVRDRPTTRELLYSYDLRSAIAKLPTETRFLLLVMFLASMASVPSGTLVPIYIVYKLNLSTVTWGIIVSVANIAYLVVGMALSLYVDKMRRSLLSVGSALMMVANIFGIVPSSIAVLLYFVVLQVGSQLASTSIQSDMGDKVADKGRGNAIGLVIISQLIGQSVGSYVAGISYKANPINLFIIPAAIMAITTIMAVMKSVAEHGASR